MRPIHHLAKCALGLSLALTAPLLAPNSQAIDVYTEPVGFYKVVLTTNSDTIVSIPFTRTPEFQGLIATAADSILVASNNPSWAPEQWSTPNANGFFRYYALLLSGAKKGAYFTITNNSSDSLDVILSPEDLSGIVAGDSFRIIPFWTLQTVFPNGTGVVASSSTTISQRRTQLFFPNLEGVGINLSAASTYFFLRSATLTNWVQQGFGTSNFNDVVILPDQYFIVRQTNAGTTTNVTQGAVNIYDARIPLYATNVVAASPTGQQDNFVGLNRPVTLTLNELALTNGNGFLVSAGTTVSSRRDQILVFDNSATNQNKSASATYFLTTGGWRQAGLGTNDVGTNVVFSPSSGFIVRKYRTNVTTVIWSQPATY